MIETNMEDVFHKTVENFKKRWEYKYEFNKDGSTKTLAISPAGLYNYAMSVMRYEFHKKFDDEKAKELVEQYNPNK